ncbi:MAG: hypothetical protein NW223_23910 [Hyphomicrobiaceae bacterium]|nr:hypothetical protein [Hyphomicrobiaceae bacterium]
MREWIEGLRATIKAKVAALDEELDRLPPEDWTVELQQLQATQNALIDIDDRLHMMKAAPNDTGR